MDKSNIEYYDIYDKERNKTGKIIARGTNLNEDEYHIFVQVWFFNEKNEFLVQKRSAYVSKPHIWCTSGGNVQSGEDSYSCAKREMKEELGLDITLLQGGLIDSREYIQDNQHYFCDSYCYYLGERFQIESLKLQKEEVEEVNLMQMDEIRKLMKNKQFFLYWIDYLEKIEEFGKHFIDKKK